MMKIRSTPLASAVAIASLFALFAGRAPLDEVTAVPLLAQDAGQQPEISIVISGKTGAKIRLAVPAFAVVNGTPEMIAAAKTMSDVLWNDLDYEGEFYLIPPAEAAKVPAASSVETLPYDRWTELGADAVVLGTVSPAANGLSVKIQVVGIKGDTARRQIFGKVFGGGGCSLANPRYCAHYISDDFHKSQNIDGVARTRLAFASDRNSEVVSGRMANNTVEEIYISDYDGFNARRVTVNRTLNISPSWSPDGHFLAYTSYAAQFPDVYVQNLYQVATPSRPAHGTDVIQNTHPAWSPDGTRLAFASVRPGAKNYNIFVVNRDGTGLRQLTTGDGINVAPTWAPNGNQIAFVSGRSGDAQLYLIGADGTGLTRLGCRDSHCDHPSWSAVVNKIAFTCGSNAEGYNICLLDMGTRQVSQLTDNTGSNEQPTFAPNGRHVVFVTTRWGKKQLATVDLLGKVSKRVTDTGNNSYPDWSHAPQ